MLFQWVITPFFFSHFSSIHSCVLDVRMHIAKKGDGTGPLVSLETRCYNVKVNSNQP